MKKLSDLIEEHLRQNHLIYDEKACAGADKGYLVAHRGSNVGMLCGISVYENQRRLSISIFSGAKAVAERMPFAYEFAARANDVIAIGAFCLNDAGDITFDIGASALDLDATDMWLGSLICTGLHTYNRYFPAIANVLYAGADPMEAMAKASGPSDDEVTERVAKLLGNADETPAQPTTDEDPLDETRDLWDDIEQAGTENEKPSDAPNVRIQLPQLPRIIANISPKDMEDMLREIRGEDRDDKQTGGQDGAAN